MLGIEAEEAVVVPEAHEGAGGEGIDALGRGRPDGGSHGGEIPFEEIAAVSARGDVFGERDIAVFRIRQLGYGLLVEAVDLEEHFPEARAKEIFPLREKQIHGAAIELDSRVGVLDGEGHVCRLGGDIEFPEKAGEVRVGDLVINHETGIERQHLAVFRNLYGVRVAADAVVLFEEGEVEIPFQEMGAGEAGDAGADDGDFWLNFQNSKFKDQRRLG